MPRLMDGTIRQPAPCHPARQLHAKSLCLFCYNKHRRPKLDAERYDPKQWRSRNLQKWYGISLEDYETLFEKQKGCCAICGMSEPKWGKSHLSIDHNHMTSRIRGLLCSPCNYGIGCLQDDPKVLMKAALYLQEGD